MPSAFRRIHRPAAPKFNLSRITIISLICMVAAVTIIARLFYWQVIKADQLSDAAYRQHWLTQEIPARRGRIFTKYGYVLVGNQPAYTLYVDRQTLDRSIQELATFIAPFTVKIPPTIPEPFITPTPTPSISTASAELSITPSPTPTPTPDPQSRIFNEQLRLINLLNRDARWIRLRGGLTAELKQQIEQLNIQGLSFEEESIREYPEASRSANLLGFVGSNSAGLPKGYFGLEGYYDLELAGHPGERSWEKDAYGNPILFGQTKLLPGTDGRNLITSIDRTVQYIIETKLKAGLEKYGASGGTITVMDPKTGAILGMASYPNYDPSQFSYYPPDRYPNPVVAETYEPGSIFKVLVMSAGLDSGAVDLNTICPCKGPEVIHPYVVSNYANEYHPNIDMADVIRYSDNVGMIFVSRRLGSERMLQYISNFGIGQKTGIDLQEESNAQLRPADEWREIELATASFGQGIAVTPIQMVAAVGAIANRGWLMQPHVVTKVQEGEHVMVIEPKPVRQVISEEAANEITSMMINASLFGTNKTTDLKYYKIAAKTGTAQIPIKGFYDEDKTIASFIGFAPADDPKFVMLVTMKEPQTSPYASLTSAPVWFDIAHELFLYWGIQPRR